MTSARHWLTHSVILVATLLGCDRDGSASVDALDAVDATVDLPCNLTDSTMTSTADGLTVRHHDGQSFVAWNDRATGEEGAAFRYRLYRSRTAIASDADLATAEIIARGILNHSGQMFGGAFTPEQRLDAGKPMAIMAEGEAPLPAWSGLWIANASENECAFFAVLATDTSDVPVESIVPGKNATTEPIAETVAPRAPMKVYDGAMRGPASPQTQVTGTPGLPLLVTLHASSAGGGGAGAYGDYYLYFGDWTMGYRDGLPGVFSVQETHTANQYLMMINRDAIVDPSGTRARETHWFGYVAEPEWGGERFAYPFTETRLDWMIPWVIQRYAADPERVYVSGGSMGAWGSMTYALRRPELVAAIIADRPRFRQISLTNLAGPSTPIDRLPDGQTWVEHHDSVAFVQSHPGDLPFVAWNVGRNDGYATWQEQVDMVNALTAGHHGFAFAWNDGNHSTGSAPAQEIAKWYRIGTFARNVSYPAFGNSSIDQSLDSLEGGINLGFSWTVTADEAGEWSAEISNALATSNMTVDVTPRRTQKFDPAPGTTVMWTSSLGEQGSAVVDANGLVTVPSVALQPGTATTLTLRTASRP